MILLPMPHDFFTLLTSAGFLPSEARVYLSALALGPSTAQHIAQKANISRTAAYEAIETLRRHGLISETVVRKRRLFTAEDPERLIAYLEGQKERFTATLGDIARSVDALRMVAGGARPVMKVYEGEEALYAYFDNIAAANPDELLEMTNIDDVYANIESEHLLQARKAIDAIPAGKYKVLYAGSPRNPRSGVAVAWIRPELFGEFHGSCAIYGNNLALVTLQEKLVCIVIESPVLTQTMRVMFSMAWAAAAAQHENK